VKPAAVASRIARRSCPRALDLRTELQTDRDDHRPKHDRNEHVGDAREPREPRDAPGRIAPRAPQHRQWQPVVGEESRGRDQPRPQRPAAAGAVELMRGSISLPTGCRRKATPRGAQRQTLRQAPPRLIEQLVEPAVQRLRFGDVSLAGVNTRVPCRRCGSAPQRRRRHPRRGGAPRAPQPQGFPRRSPRVRRPALPVGRRAGRSRASHRSGPIRRRGWRRARCSERASRCRAPRPRPSPPSVQPPASRRTGPRPEAGSMSKGFVRLSGGARRRAGALLDRRRIGR